MSFNRAAAHAPHRIAGGVSFLLLGFAGMFYGGIWKPAETTEKRSAPRQSVTPVQARGIMPLSQSTLPSFGGTDADNAPQPLNISKKKSPVFTVTNLAAPLPVGKRVELASLSNTGTVLATLYDPLPPALPNGRPARRPAPAAHVARFENGVWKPLPMPPGVAQVIAGEINDRGDAVAVSVRFRRGKPSYNRLILYPSSGALQDLGTLDARFADPETTNFERMRGVGEGGLSINNRGVITAMVGNTSWIRRPDGSANPVPSGVLSDFNETNMAVGYGKGKGGVPLLWRDIAMPSDSVPASLVPIRMGADGSSEPVLRGIPECINNRGHSVMNVTIEANRGFRRQGLTAYYLVRDKKLRQIGCFNGFQRFSTRINDQGDVVGFTETDQEKNVFRPHLYRRGELYDLTDVAIRQGWRIVGAVDINNWGQIIAYGVRVDDSTSPPAPLLLSPSSTPAVKTATARRSN
ncbi:MAG: hypothetical protein H8F28_04655 [Fibrella sp.]|nr:hypothetical protein [Armatimonadota bacterium]